MLLRLSILFLMFVGASTGWVCASDDPESEGWTLVYQTDFNSDDALVDWIPLGKTEMRIEDGKLILSGPGKAMVQFREPLPSDQKIVWTAAWAPTAGRGIVQHGMRLRSNGVEATGADVWPALGRMRNTRNLIAYFGWEYIARNNGPLPEPGVTYTLEATMEGRHVTLSVDGEPLLAGDMPFDLPYESFDSIYLSGNNSLLSYDSIAIYTKPPTQKEIPVTTVPEVKDTAVQALLERLADPFAEDYMEANAQLLKYLQAHPESDPGTGGPLSLTEASQMMTVVADPRRARPHRMGRTIILKADLPQNHPFWAKAVLEYGRCLYWNGREQHNETVMDLGKADLRLLKERGYDSPVLAAYLGERQTWSPSHQPDTTGAPAWAVTQIETYIRILDIIGWWGAHRQTPRGDLGGGWGDDVEILRNWGTVIAVGQASPEAEATVMRLIDGAWEHAYGGLQGGYMKRIEDVEHSSEPTADTQPVGLFLQPDDSKYVERNRKLLPLVLDKWSALDPQGYRRMKSSYIGLEGAEMSPSLEGDVPYHTRAYKGLTWLTSLSDQPDVQATMLEIADAWREATLREEGGKLAGVSPAAVYWKTGQLGTGNTRDWYKTGMDWTYFDYNRNNQTRILQLLISAYEWTGDAKYLEPVEACLTRAREGDSLSTVPVAPADDEMPSADYQRWLLSQWKAKGMFLPLLARLSQGSGVHLGQPSDYSFGGKQASLKEQVAAAASHFQETGDIIPVVDMAEAAVADYQLTGNPEAVTAVSQAYLDAALGRDFPMWTSEPLSTDRVYIPTANAVYTLMTGATGGWGDPLPPDAAVSWQFPSLDFAVLAHRTSRDSVSIRLYSFLKKTAEVGLSLRTLPKGRYHIRYQSPDGSESVQTVTHDGKLQWLYFNVPGRTESRIEISPVAG